MNDICEGWHFTHTRHLYDRNFSLRGETWAHKASLTPSRCIEVHVQSQESERSCIYVFGVLISSLSKF